MIGLIFVAATFVITTTPYTTMAYTCSSSSSTHNVNVASSVNGNFGSCSSSSSLTTTSGPNGSTQLRASGPPDFPVAANALPPVPRPVVLPLLVRLLQVRKRQD
jgi:hypothetical protein